MSVCACVCIHTGIQKKLTAISEYSMHTRFFVISYCLLSKIRAHKTYFLVHEYRASLNIYHFLLQ